MKVSLIDLLFVIFLLRLSRFDSLDFLLQGLSDVLIIGDTEEEICEDVD